MASKFLVKLSISLSIALPNSESKEKSIQVPTLSWLACGDSVIDLEARTNLFQLELLAEFGSLQTEVR